MKSESVIFLFLCTDFYGEMFLALIFLPIEEAAAMTAV